jgi:hypothetical protein
MRPADGDVQQKTLDAGARWPEAEALLPVRSYVATARTQGMNPLSVLRRLFEGTLATCGRQVLNSYK